ncbi:MAG: hypothetical protein ALECFALPRED_002912 [Alectoria fallacina]|uniref:Uncharacterized protein n=1 Tax=Alectoria fallacina TaxID=1903189 RepID=A0A8H3FIH3_9LECA|nr:MAG: hypothetical protein ALECFALPRED_002912 [Alectoria fallacina]
MSWYSFRYYHRVSPFAISESGGPEDERGEAHDEDESEDDDDKKPEGLKDEITGKLIVISDDP